jgi:hypothetical protein
MTNSEYQPTQIEQLFLKYYDGLIKEITYARAHFKLWERLEESVVEYQHELNEAPHFFNLTIKSHLDDAILTISRIVDTNEESMSIWKFLCFVEQNINIFSTQSFQKHTMNSEFHEGLVNNHLPITLDDIQKHRKDLDNLKQVMDAIKKWRDKRLAHLDRAFLLKGINISIQRQQFNLIIDTIAHILNKYSSAYNASSWSIQFVGEDDVQGILNAVRFRKNERKKQIEALRLKTPK